MAWDLSVHDYHEPSDLTHYLLAVGRSLYVACGFEQKCQQVFGLVTLVEAFEKSGDADYALRLVRELRAPRLGSVVPKFRKTFPYSHSDVDTLERARVARNFVAHESGDLGPLYSLSSESIARAHSRLRDSLRSLVAGDAVVSRWLFEMSEKEPNPRSITESYESRMLRWVFSEHPACESA